MNREQLIALLAQWGVQASAEASLEHLVNLVQLGPKSIRNAKGGKKLNSAGAAHASSLISSGKIKDSDSWSPPSADAENSFVEEHGWSEYSKWHLGMDPSADNNTKGHYAFPFTSDFKEVDYAGLRACITRAAQAGYSDIEHRARALYESAGKKLGKDTKSEKNALESRIGFRVLGSLDPTDTSPVEIMIYGDIGEGWFGEQGYGADDFTAALKEIDGNRNDKRPITIRLHSGGGNVWDSFAIHNAIKNRGNVTTRIDGIAASAADVIFQAGQKRVMPSLAMRMAHNPMALFQASGNADQLREQVKEFSKTIDRLQKHTATLAKMYADRSGNSLADCQAMMNSEEFMDGDEALLKGFCDETTDEMPVTDKLYLAHTQPLPSIALNFVKPLPQGAATKSTIKNQVIMNKKQMLALLKQWGVTVADNATDQQIIDLITAGPPIKNKVAPKYKNGQDGEHADDCDCDQCKDADGDNDGDKMKNKQQTIIVAKLSDEDQNAIRALRAEATLVRRNNLRGQLTTLAQEGRIPLNSVPNWLTRAEAAVEDKAGVNPVIADLKLLEVKLPGIAPLGTIDFNDTTSIQDVANGVKKNNEPRRFMLNNPGIVDVNVRKDIAAGAKAISNIIKKQIARVCATIPDEPGEGGLGSVFNKRRAEAIANFLNNDLKPILNDQQNGPYGPGGIGVSVSSDLQRQVILSEAMRAFKRRILPLTAFAHNFNDIPLQGKDEIDVPYYPLFTTGSQRFTQKDGYQFLNSDQEFRRQITVGGQGPDNKVAGQDRAYQAMTYSAYLIRRQPWVDIQRLAVLRAEQLALDVLNDVITAWVLKANFGNAVWAGAPGAFDDTSVAFLAGVTRKADWPESPKNLVIGTDYWVNLASSPYVKAFLNIGDTGVIREGRIGGLYGFEDTIENPRIPVTADGNLVGFVAYPSAVLVATSPILPAPGEMKLMVSYDLAVDEDIGLTFEYKYWGEPWNSADREIIECNYGSGLGELAALKRIVANGQ